MSRFLLASILIILPVVFSAPTEKVEEKGRFFPYVVGSTVTGGAAGAQYGQQAGSSDIHDKKTGSLSFSSDRGSSNRYSNTDAQVGVVGGAAQGSYPVYSLYGYYPYYYYPGYGVNSYGGYLGYNPYVQGVSVPQVPGYGLPSVPQVPGYGVTVPVVPQQVPVPVRY